MTTAQQLPQWDLSDLFGSFESPEYEKGYIQATTLSTQLASYKDVLENGSIAPEEMGKALRVFEELEVLLLHLYAYSHMQYDVDTTFTHAKKENERATKFLTEIEASIEWFSQGLKKLSSEKIDALVAHPELAAYAHFFKTVKLYEKYTLLEKEEQLLHKKDLYASTAWSNFHTEIASNIEFGKLMIEGKEVEMNQALLMFYLAHPDREIRKAVYDLRSKGFGTMEHIFAYVYAQVAASFEQDSREVRGYESGLFRASMGDEVTPAHIEAMVDVTKANVHTYQDYFSWKKEQLGLETMMPYDASAPLTDEKEEISFEEARDMVLDCFGTFDGEMRDLAAQFFDKKWIDAREGGNKYAGAYSWSMKEHPYILLNYQPNLQQVFTMIHELGHGVHSLLTNQKQPYLMRNHSKVTAESASQFAELLLLDYVLKSDRPASVKRSVLAHHVEDLLYCLSSTITVTAFEMETHEKATKEALTKEDLSDIWMNLHKTLRGEAITTLEDDRMMWSRIPHIFQTPFYYFTYPMSLLVVLCLYELYTENPQQFVKQYKDYLSLGGSMTPEDCLKQSFGIEFGTKEFYEKGFRVVERLIAQLKAM